MTLLERRRKQHFRAKAEAAMSNHFNIGTRIHSVGSGSKAEEDWKVFACACGAPFVEYLDLLTHIREENEREEKEKSVCA